MRAGRSILNFHGLQRRGHIRSLFVFLASGSERNSGGGMIGIVLRRHVSFLKWCARPSEHKVDSGAEALDSLLKNLRAGTRDSIPADACQGRVSINVYVAGRQSLAQA